MDLEEVTGDGAPAPSVPAGQGKEEPFTITKAEVESLRRELAEARESERYWSGAARASSARPAATHEPEEDGPNPNEFLDDQDLAATGIEGDTPEKLVDEFAAQGVGALAKRGFITKADAHRIAADVALKVSRELISRERQKMTTDDTIMREFPDLKDQESELFRETAKRYQAAVRMDPSAMKTPAALYLAAQAAQEALSGRRSQDGNGNRDDDRRGGPEREEDRRQRASSQDGRTRARTQVADDDMLGDEAKQIIKQMGISDKEFLESRKATAGMRSRR